MPSADWALTMPADGSAARPAARRIRVQPVGKVVGDVVGAPAADTTITDVLKQALKAHNPTRLA